MKLLTFISILLLGILTNSFGQKHNVQYDTNILNNDLVFKFPDTLNNSYLPLGKILLIINGDIFNYNSILASS